LATETHARGRRQPPGDFGKRDEDIDRQEAFVSAPRDFEDKLRRATTLHLDPDLNDGVVLNIAPLWELVPWKEARSYWDDPWTASTSGRPSASNCGRKGW